MNSNSINGVSPSQPTIPPIIIPPKTDAQTDVSSLIGDISLGEKTPSSTNLKERTTVPIEGSAQLEEADQIIKGHAAQIENELKQLEYALEHAKNKRELVENIAAAESWVMWGPEMIETGKEALENGIDFLEHVLPDHYIHKLPHLPELETVGQLTSYAGAFIKALEYGSEGIALICRSKILEQSKKVLKHYQEIIQTEPTTPYNSEEMENLRKIIFEWEISIHLEEEKFHEELLKFKLSTTSKGVYLLSLPPSYIFKDTPLAKWTSLACSLIMGGLAVILSALQLKKTKSEAESFLQWKKSYQKWAEEHQPLLLTQGDSITGKFEAANRVVQTGKELLAKRMAARQTKIDKLAPDFHAVEERIRELVKRQFVSEMQQLLWEEMASYPSSTMIQEKFIQWGFFESEASSKNGTLLQAFDQFKSAQSQKGRSSASEALSLKTEFARWLEDPEALDEQFETWFSKQSQESLLGTYVEHQEIIEQTTRNALKEMVKQKHSLESQFVNFKLNKSTIELSFASIALAISLTITILTLLTILSGGTAGLIVLALSIGSTLISLGLFGAGYLLFSRLKPNIAKASFSLTFQIEMMWAKLRSSIHTYSLQAKEKKLLEVALVVRKLHHSSTAHKQDKSEYQKALVKFKQAKIDFEECEAQVDRWSKKVKKMESHLSEKNWEDFALQADLPIDVNAFDTLQAFQDAFQAADLRLLSGETKTLLTDHLGIDLDNLQQQIQANPAAIQDTFREFFALDSDSLLSFIKKQHLHIQTI